MNRIDKLERIYKLAKEYVRYIDATLDGLCSAAEDTSTAVVDYNGAIELFGDYEKLEKEVNALDEKVNMKISNLELRCLSDELSQLEIIRWCDKDSCIMIAYWQEDDEGYELRFVGARPLDKEVCQNDFMKLVKLGQDKLDEEFNLEKNGE